MKKNYSVVFGLLLCSLLLAGCGSGSNKGKSSEAAYAVSEESYSNYNYDGVNSYSETADYEEEALESEQANEDIEDGNYSSDRKLIRNVNMSVETDDLDDLMNKIDNKIKECGGYAQYTSVSGNSSSYSNSRTASLTVRIPGEKLDMFLEGVSGASNVLNKSENIEDVTLKYVDMQSKINSLRTENDRLNELLSEADSLETVIALEERLAEVRYELESYESSLRVLENDVTYSTVDIYISEVVKYTPVDDDMSVSERMVTEFVDSCINVGEDIQNFLVYFVGALPYLFIYAILIGIIVLIAILCSKNSKKKAAARIAKKAEELNKKAREASANSNEKDNSANSNVDNNAVNVSELDMENKH